MAAVVVIIIVVVVLLLLPRLLVSRLHLSSFVHCSACRCRAVRSTCAGGASATMVPCTPNSKRLSTVSASFCLSQQLKGVAFSRLAVRLLLKAWLLVKLFRRNRAQSQSRIGPFTKPGPPERPLPKDVHLSTNQQLDRRAVPAMFDSHRPAA